MSNLYIIAAVGTTRPVKIGIADDPAKRCRQLQTGSAAPLQVIAHFSAGSRARAATWERQAHLIFAEHRLAGEWFDVDHEAVIARRTDWERQPTTTRRSAHRPALVKGATGFHPTVPEHLQRPISQLTPDERIAFWSCFDLPAPPEGCDDWFVIGSATSGVMGAVAVEGFFNGEPQ